MDKFLTYHHFRLPVHSRGRQPRGQRWSMVTVRMPQPLKALISGKRSLSNLPGITRKCKYRHLISWFLNGSFNTLFSRLAKQKVLQADYDKEVSSFKGQVDGLKSKNNVSINNNRTFVPLHNMSSSNQQCPSLPNFID